MRNTRPRWIPSVLDSIGYGEGSLLAIGEEGEMFQVINLGEGYLFVCSDGEHYITDFDDIPDAVFASRQNFIIRKEDITSVDIGVDYADEKSSVIEWASIKIRWTIRVKGRKGSQKQRKSLLLVLTDDIEEDKLRAFFDGAGKLSLMASHDFEEINKPALAQGEKDTRRGLLTALAALPAASVLSAVGGTLAHGGLQKFLVMVCALLPFVLLALFFLFPRYFVIRRERSARSDDITLETDLPLGIMMLGEVILSLCGNTILYSLPFDHLVRWTITALVPVMILTALLFVLPSQVRRSEWKDSLYLLILWLIYLLPISFCSVYLLNYSLDIVPPAVHQAVIWDKSTEHEDEYRTLTEYYVHTKRPYEVYETFEVSQVDYQRAKRGAEVLVEEHRGALGIAYETIVLLERGHKTCLHRLRTESVRRKLTI